MTTIVFIKIFILSFNNNLSDIHYYVTCSHYFHINVIQFSMMQVHESSSQSVSLVASGPRRGSRRRSKTNNQRKASRSKQKKRENTKQRWRRRRGKNYNKRKENACFEKDPCVYVTSTRRSLKTTDPNVRDRDRKTCRHSTRVDTIARRGHHKTYRQSATADTIARKGEHAIKCVNWRDSLTRPEPKVAMLPPPLLSARQMKQFMTFLNSSGAYELF